MPTDIFFHGNLLPLDELGRWRYLGGKKLWSKLIYSPDDIKYSFKPFNIYVLRISIIKIRSNNQEEKLHREKLTFGINYL